MINNDKRLDKKLKLTSLHDKLKPVLSKVKWEVADMLNIIRVHFEDIHANSSFWRAYSTRKLAGIISTLARKAANYITPENK